MTQEQGMQKECPLQVGQVVRSKQGRDKGNILMVYQLLDAKNVTVIDGKERPIERPKKKRIIHLQPFHHVVPLVEAMENEQGFNNAWVRKQLKVFQDKAYQTEEESECHLRM